MWQVRQHAATHILLLFGLLFLLFCAAGAVGVFSRHGYYFFLDLLFPFPVGTQLLTLRPFLPVFVPAAR